MVRRVFRQAAQEESAAKADTKLDVPLASSKSVDQSGTELDPKLRQLIEGLGLDETTEAVALRTAAAWCDEQGCDSLEALREVEMEADFVTALQLKPIKHKQLLKRIVPQAKEEN